MTKRYVYIFVIVAFLTACGGGGGNKTKPQDPAFPMVEVPAIIAEPEARTDYLAERFWDRVTDIKSIPSEELESKFALWATLLKRVTPDVISAAMDRFFAGSDSLKVATILPLADDCFYNPNSELRNEEAYLCFLKHLLRANLPDESKRTHYEFCLKMCSMNRPGYPAADFAFTTREGKIRTLYSVKAPVILLFFSNPGCPLCASYQEALEADEALNGKIKTGELCVVNIYPDADVEAWKEYVSHYPQEWVCGRDHLLKVRADLIYSLRAIPSLYLLDSDKKVILKDAVYSEVEMELHKLLY